MRAMSRSKDEKVFLDTEMGLEIFTSAAQANTEWPFLVLAYQSAVLFAGWLVFTDRCVVRSCRCSR